MPSVIIFQWSFAWPYIRPIRPIECMIINIWWHNKWNITLLTLPKLVFPNCTYALGTDHLTCRGGYVFLCFVQKIVSDNTRVRYIFVFVARNANLFSEFNIRLYDKNSESDYFVFLHQNQNILFSNSGNQNMFLE